MHTENDQYYAALVPESSIFDELLAFATDESTSAGWIEYYGFKTKVLPQSLILKDPVLVALNAAYPFSAGILKLDPAEVYEWHVDERRKAALNMLLSGRGTCLFCPESPQELVYPVRRFTAFNTQVPHKVVNGSTERILFSVEFNDVASVTYEDLVSFAVDNNYFRRAE
jgi:hypothetical protein